MTKQKIFLGIPLITISGLLIYSWVTILTTDIIATWQHYLALGLFALLVFLCFRSFKKTVVATALYLLLATFNAFSMTPQITSGWIKIGSMEMPHFQPLSLGLLVVFLILNFDTLINIYLDYKESKGKRKT